MAVTDVDTSAFKNLASKKIAGIPVLYLAAGAAVIGLVYALKMKSKVTPTTAPDGTEGTDDTPTSQEPDYSAYDTTGTVVVQPQQPATAEPVVETNDTWSRAAIQYLIDTKAATPGAATEAISAYIDGSHLTYEQGLLRDAAITKLGPPPSIPSVGGTDTQPARKQFSVFPGTHTVKGDNDNTAIKLSSLYYGSVDANHVYYILEANTQYGLSASTPYDVGTKVKIPAYAGVKYYTTTKTVRTFKDVAAKNGLTSEQIKALNPARSETAGAPLPIGLKVRVR